ncbi:MAG: hypothetical protein ACRD8Z_10575 [Nitrososphaeraceae archaeon]
MTCNKDLAEECGKIQYNVREINLLSVELRECLTGLTRKELDYKDIKETDDHRLKIAKGMSNRDLDIQTFQVWRAYDILSDYLLKLRLELDKRAKYSLIPVDGNDWEAACKGGPSIGPRIDMTVEESGYE